MPGGRCSACRRRSLKAALRSDRGDIAVTTAIVLPLMLLLAWLGIQAITWHWAAEAALTAAREGAQRGSEYQGSAAGGAREAQDLVDRLAGDNLRGATVSTAGSSATRVRIEVSGLAPSLVPGMDGLRVTQSASAPVERWTKQGEVGQ